MKKWFDEQEQDVRKKRSKRASNRPGEGMRIINIPVDEEDWLLEIDDSVDSDDEANYNRNTIHPSNLKEKK